jgi:glycosyltransferase involved in cell wall biosynthesis
MISVIVPTYNQADYLARTIESVWAQDVDDVEIVVVDDGSTDHTVAVLQELSKRDRFRFIHQENRGPAAARNRGIRESHGELIAFLDGDDFWLPGKLKAQLEALQSTGYRFSFCGEQTIDERGKIVAVKNASEKDCAFAELVWGNRIATPTVLVERSLLDECGLFEESMRTGEDWDLWLRLSAEAPGACVPEPLVAVLGTRRWRADANQLPSYEHSTNRVLERIFELASSHEDLAPLMKMKGRIRSWHFAILAKSLLLNARKFRAAFGYAVRAITSSPRGLIYLVPKLRAQDANETSLSPPAPTASGGPDARAPMTARAPSDFQVSVVIRTYNRAAMLPDALESALNQTLPAQEIVIVDDGSTDETAEVVSSYQQKHPEIRYVKTESNLGPGRAAERGVRECRSAYVAFLDSDDVWLPNHLEQIATEFANHPDAVLVFTRYGLLNARREPLVDLVSEPPLSDPPWRQLVLKKIIVQPTRMAIRRAAISAVGGFPSFTAGEDWALVVLLAARFPQGVIQSNTRSAFFRLHTAQSSSRPLQVRQALLDATEYVFTQLPGELKPRVIATNLLHCAVFLWQAGDPVEGWRSLTRAVMIRPLSIFTKEFWVAFPRLLLPPSLGRLMRGWKRSLEKRRSTSSGAVPAGTHTA